MTKLLAALTLLAAFASAAHAQTSDTGFPDFSPQATFGSLDSISETNLNIHLSIPVLTKVGSPAFSYVLSGDTGSGPGYFADPTNGPEWYGPMANNAYILGNDNGYPGYAPMLGQPAIGSPCTWTDPSNTVHLVSCNGNPEISPDGSGFTSIYVSGVFHIYDKSGKEFTPGASLADPNGNAITWTGPAKTYDAGPNFFTDSLGQKVLTITPNGQSTTYTYTGPNNTTQTLTVSVSSHSVASSFACPGIREYSTSWNLVDSVSLPDGTAYTFGYLTDGRLAQINLPTGGWIKYTYPGSNNGVNCGGQFTAAITRTTSDGAVWKITRTRLGSSTVTDQSGNVTTFNTYSDSFTNLALTSRVGPLDQTVTCYNGATETAVGATTCTAYYAPSQNTAITQVNTYHTIGSKHRLTTIKLDNNGNITDTYVYDWYNGTSYPLISHTATPRGSWNGSACSSIGNYITDRPCYKNVYDGSGTLKSSEVFTYDSKGNLLSHTASPAANIGASGNLTTSYSYNTNGTVNQVTDVNGAASTYGYGNGCNSLLPTSFTNASGTSNFTWDCVGGVLTSTTDANGAKTQYSYVSSSGPADPYWRPLSVTDPTGAVTTTCYGLVSNGACSPNANQTESVLSFNSGASAVDKLVTRDGLGHPTIAQTRQAPSSTNFDTVSTSYDLQGRVASVSVPCVQTTSQPCPSSPVTTTTYDALSRPLLITDGGGGTTNYTYSANDTLITTGPAPAGENVKKRQLEVDGLGRLTSVCEITSASGSGTCSQASSATGYWTRYGYDVLGNLTSVSQNAQGTAQTRSYSYDALSRLTVETNPESGTTQYFYDSAPSSPGSACSGTFSGDVVKKYDANGNTDCFTYDALHRVTSASYPSGPNAGATAAKTFVYDASTFSCPSAPVVTGNVAGRLAEAYTGTSGAKITDIGYCYSPRGELTDVFETTPHSGGAYHSTAAYFANGAVQSITGIPSASMAYGLDGEGRPSSAQEGGTKIVCDSSCSVASTMYNAASQPLTISIGGFSDNDTYTYDNANRMKTYAFTVGSTPASVQGSLTWNQNGTLQQLAITDGFNSAGTQTCNYLYDDLARIGTPPGSSAAGVNCVNSSNSAIWNQSFSYDAFGNITKSGSISWLPGYNSNNRYTLAGTSYDADGNILKDTFHTYTWDATGHPVTIDSTNCGSNGTCLTYDALGQMVEKSVNSTFSEILYSPLGKSAVMSGQTLTNTYLPLPGGGTAFLTPNGHNYWHKDWLGSVRFGSAIINRNSLVDRAFAPFGEVYDDLGQTNQVSFAGDTSDTIAKTYDTQNRDLNPTQGRWLSPDPAGLGAADPTNPQSWNRYAYALNNPLRYTDPSGLYCFYGGDGDTPQNDGDSSDFNFDEHGDQGRADCAQEGGQWFEDDTQITVNGDAPNDPGITIENGEQVFPEVDPPSFGDCVKSGTDYFSVQHGLQATSGGRLGTSWASSAFLGSSVSSFITVGQYFSSLFSGTSNAPSGGEAFSAGAGEVVSDTSGPVASTIAPYVPNVGVTLKATATVAVSTPTISAAAKLSVSASGTIPFSGVVSVGGKVLNGLGAAKLPYDLAVGSFSGLVCSIGR